MLTPCLDSVGEWMGGLCHHFWDHHFTLGSQPAPKPVRLLGEARVNEILANVIAPMLVLTNHSDWEAYKCIRADLGNRRLSIVCRRLFGEKERSTEHLRFLYQQQGLLQIFEDFCLADTTNCAGCRFPEMVTRLHRSSA